MDIFVSGLGGLGLINLTHRLYSLLSCRYEKVIYSQNRGIAQRRGSVSSYIRSGSDILSSELHYNSRADIIIALEALEALRNPKLVKNGTVCFVADMRIDNLGRAQGSLRYPDIKEITYTLTKLGAKVIILPYEAFMREEKLSRTHVSSACLSVFGSLLGFSLKEMEMLFPDLLVDDRNKKAFYWGANLFDFNNQHSFQQKTAYYPQQNLMTS